ncbi:MAG: carboxylate--amine ligase [Planctomycetota bacterium]|jgi:predicted ATP-grasp superfamily ATP-dependent carboligase
MGKVLVTDAGGRNVVCVVRSLGQRGIEVVACEESRFALSFFSKYCGRRLVYPSPKQYPQRWLDWLIEEISRNSYDMVMPIGGDCFRLISKHRSLIGQYTKVPVVAYASWIKGWDKAETLKLAIEIGVPHPKTRFISSLNEVETAGLEIGFPLVIKPTQSCGSRGIAYVYTKKELIKNYIRIHAEHPLPLIQEFIPPGGNAYGVFLLFDRNSETKAVFVHKRLREFPVKGGPSTLRESVHKPELVDRSLKLLKALKWYGVAMVEYKEDPRDGKCKIMEINPRFWGSLPLCIAAGVDFPYLLYKMVVEGDVKPVMNYPQGIRCRWLLPGDILHFLMNPNRFRMKPSFFNFSKNNRRDDFISWKDPGPTFGFFLTALTSLLNIKSWKHVFARG